MLLNDIKGIKETARIANHYNYTNPAIQYDTRTHKVSAISYDISLSKLPITDDMLILKHDDVYTILFKHRTVITAKDIKTAIRKIYCVN